MPLSLLKPAVPKCWLFALSGILWSMVGLMMCATALGWLTPEGIVRGSGFALVGLVLAGLAARLGFDAIARRNVLRLRRLPDRGCFFAFQAWRGYLVIMVMLVLGIAMRHSPVPKSFLAVVYTAIGGALLLSSLPYYRHLRRLMRSAARRCMDRRKRA
jgi:hypothetical protein